MDKKSMLDYLDEKMDVLNKGWRQGVYQYAYMILANVEGDELSEKHLLNGADNWYRYSEGGLALAYDYDIANAVCTNTKLKRWGTREFTLGENV